MTNRAEFVVGLQGDEGDISKIFAAFKRQIKSDAAEIESTLAKVEFFKGADSKLDGLRAAALSARQRVVELGQAISTSLADGGKAPEQMTKALAAAEKAATSATNAYNRQANQVDKLRASLNAAGVDTSNLAAAENRLATAAKAAADAEAQRQARQALGIKTTKDVEGEIAKLQSAYNTLASSGTLSFKQLDIAQGNLKTKIADLRKQVTAIGPATSGIDLAGFFQRSILPALGLVSAVSAVGTAIKDSIQAAQDYKQRLAEIGTVTNLTDEQLARLGGQARALSEDLGLNLSETLKGVLDLLRAGVPEENVIEVLRVSAQAAKASVTDLGSGVKATSLLLNTFGADTKDLPRLFDAIVQGAHDGGASFKEFSDNAGPLLAVARSANVPFNELIATLTVLVKNSGNAEQSVADLTKIIAKIDTEEARKKLRDLGIEGNGLLDTFQKIGAKGLGLNQILELGVASTKSAGSIAALTKNAGALSPELDKINGAAGATQVSLTRMLDTPVERQARLNAALDGLLTRLGLILGTSSRLGVALTQNVNLFNRFFDAVAERQGGDALAFFNQIVLSFQGVTIASKPAETAVKAVSAAVGDFTDKNDRLSGSIQRAHDALVSLATDLAAEVQAIQTALTRNVGDVNAQAAAQIAALDRSLAASKATAAATIEIQTKLAADRLAIIAKAEAEIAAAIDKAEAARIDKARKDGQSEQRIATETALARIAALQPVLAQYQAHYNALVQQAQGFATKQQQFDQQRIEFNRGIEAQLFNIRLTGLSVFDQYVAKSEEADRLISAARKAGAEGDIKSAKEFTDQAIAFANQLGTVTDENGNKIVTALQAQTDKTNIIKKAAQGYNDVLNDQAKAAKDGADATKKGIDEVLPKLTNLQAQYDALKKTVDAGLLIKVQQDEASVAKVLATLNDLTKDRTVTITVNTVNSDGTPAPTSPSGGGNGEHFAAGGMVGRRSARPRGVLPIVAAFARGGSVFQRPAWTKVPGSGNQDTVPAALKAGSFVVRKSASQFYGDSIMRTLARGYAAGGIVTKDDVKKFADNRWGFDPFSSKVFDPVNIGGRTDPSGPDGPNAPQTDPKKGFRSGDTFQDAFTQRVINLDTRPIPAALITAANVLAYAKEMLNSVNQNNPLLGSLGQDVLSGISAVSRNPANTAALDSLLQAAQTIGSNPYLFDMWGKTAGSPGSAQEKPEWFLDWLVDRGLVDGAGKPTGGGGGVPAGLSGTGQPGSLLAQNVLGRALRNFGTDIADRLFHPVGNLLPNASNNFAKNFFQTAIPAAGDPPFVQIALKQQIDDLRKRLVRPFAAGGSTDTVRAMLTPGEFVFRQPVVSHYGTNFMNALNAQLIPKSSLDILLSPPRRFADGGLVGAAGTNVGSAGGSAAGVPTVVNNFTVNASAQDLFSERNLERYVVPFLNNRSANAFKR